MSIKMKTTRYTENYLNDVYKLNEAIDHADTILVGAGAGLSTAAGLTYTGERFKKHFHDFIDIYHFPDMYTGGFHSFDSLEEQWAYWSRYIYINRYASLTNGAYERLLSIIKDKNYFILTTNVDHQFQKAGFDKQRLFYTQGDYGLWQCSIPCHQKTYDNQKVVEKMVTFLHDMRIPSELIPHCPICGEPMSMNLRADDRFVEDDGWHKASERYASFIHKLKDENILILELGTGFNTPGIIKYPFWQLTYRSKNARYFCINLNDTDIPEQIRDRSICIEADCNEVFKTIEKQKSSS